MEKSELAVDCYNVLAKHGISLHYEILGKIVRDVTGSKATDRQVLSTLTSNPDMFSKLDTGVYFLKGKSENRVYEEYQ